MFKIFFDANILLDILLPTRPNHKLATQAYVFICERYGTLATSENILTTIEYIATKNGTPCKTIGNFFKAMNENFELYGFADILDNGLAAYNDLCKQSKKIDFENLLQLECAIYHKCNLFLTEDKDIYSDKIQILGLQDIV